MIGLTLEQILQLHALVLVKDCGAGGVRDVRSEEHTSELQSHA